MQNTDLNSLENPNEHCLEGMACPRCNSFGPFDIEVIQTAMTTVADSGAEPPEGDLQWTNESECECRSCGLLATVEDFKELNSYQKQLLAEYDEGDYADLLPSEVKDCGDTLLYFLFLELSDEEDCESRDDAVSRIDTAIEQLQALRTSFDSCAPVKIFKRPFQPDMGRSLFKRKS